MALAGCGSATKTVTETIEVETRTTTEGGGSAQPNPITEFCSSPEGEEIDAVAAEANQALSRGDGPSLVGAIETMIEIAKSAPPGARCVFAPLDSSKILLTEYPELIRRISQVEQSRELTEADVERIERKGE